MNKLKQWFCETFKRHKYTIYIQSTEFGNNLKLITEFKRCDKCNKVIDEKSEVVEIIMTKKRGRPGKNSK